MSVSVIVLTYNRDVLPCLKAIKANTYNNYELILVDNGKDYSQLWDKYVDKYVRIDNEGVKSRNYGKLIAKYNYIACVDDDVLVFPGWDEILIDAIESDDSVIGSGPCGAYAFKDLSNYNETYGKPGDYVDVLTGFCWMHKNIPEGLLPIEDEWFHWHEETYVQFQMRELGYRFKMTPNVCFHDSQRNGTIDWEDHNNKIGKVKARFNINNLNLEKV